MNSTSSRKTPQGFKSQGNAATDVCFSTWREPISIFLSMASSINAATTLHLCLFILCDHIRLWFSVCCIPVVGVWPGLPPRVRHPGQILSPEAAPSCCRGSSSCSTIKRARNFVSSFLHKREAAPSLLSGFNCRCCNVVFPGDSPADEIQIPNPPISLNEISFNFFKS